MEKYSKWRDFGTGIMPFLPITPPNIHKGAIDKVKNAFFIYIAGITLSISRLFAIIAIMSIDGLTTNILSYIAPTSYYRNSFQNITRRLFASMALFVSGFYKIQENVYSAKKFKVSKDKPSKKQKIPRSGDIIISNHASYIDILYFISRYNPVFFEIDNATLHMRPLKGWSAIISSCSKPNALLNAKDAKTLRQISEDARKYNMGPVVIFPENTTTNGLALLQFLPIFSNFDNIDEKSSIFITALKYPSKEFSPTFSMGNPLNHFFWLNSSFFNQLIVTVVDSADTPKFTHDDNKSGDRAKSPTLENIDVDKEINSALISCSRLRQTKLTALDKLDFLNYYSNKSKQYKSK